MELPHHTRLTMIDCYFPLAKAVRASQATHAMQEGNANVHRPMTVDTTRPKVSAGTEPQYLTQRQFCKAIARREIVSLEQVQSFLERGADLNQPTTLGDIRNGTPLHWAAIAGNGHAVEALIASRQLNDIDVMYNGGFTPLALMCGAKSDICLPLLPNEIPPLRDREVEQINRNKGLKALLDNGANPKLSDGQQLTPLHHAAENNWPELILTLTGDASKLVNLNAPDASKNTPLHRAASKGHFGPVSILLAQGADLHCTNNYGETALHRLCLSAPDDSLPRPELTTTKTANLLLNHGADPNQVDQKSKHKIAATPIDHAVRLGKNNLVRALVNYSQHLAGKSSLQAELRPLSRSSAITEGVRAQQEDQPPLASYPVSPSTRLLMPEK